MSRKVPVQVRCKERVHFKQRDWGQWHGMAAPSSFKAVEDIWSVLTDGDNVWSTKK